MFQKVLIENCKQLPIKEINTSEQSEMERKVDEILKSYPNKFKIIEFEIDHLVYKLYDLTEEEIRIVEEAVG